MPGNVIQLVQSLPDQRILETLNLLVTQAHAGEISGFAGAVIWKGGRWEYFTRGLAERRPETILPPVHSLLVDLSDRINGR